MGDVEAVRVDDQQRADLRAFGLRVQQLRAARGWTQHEAAAACGIDRSYLATVETGKRNAGIAMVYRLARGLGVEPADLFS
jgi:transcriptional regulator with XRE-family HTH domain